MKIIGITGGVGSGKSAVLDYLADTPSSVIVKTDDVAKELMKPGTPCFRKLVYTFGAGILAEDGDLNRPAVADLIFHDPDKLERMNAIVHPAVKQAVLEAVQREAENHTAWFFLESALLLEEKYDEICDELWYVYAGIGVRRQRLKHDRGYSEEKIDAILQNQLSENTFREHCRVVIDNSGDFTETIHQIQEYMKTEQKL